jgi:AI-2 transport protein TqsA
LTTGPLRSNQLAVILLGILVVLALGSVAKIMSSIVIPLLIAVLLSFVLAPLIKFLERLKVPRILAIFTVLLILMGFLYLVGLFLYASINSFVRQFPKYQARFEELYHRLNMMLASEFNVQQGILAGIDWSSAIRSSLVSISGSFMGILSDALLVMIFVIFLLIERPYTKVKLEQAFTGDTSHRIARIFDHINQEIARYLSLKFFISLATGLLVWIVLLVIGLDFALIWGVLTFLLNFIPSIGSIIAVTIISLMGVIQFFPAWGTVILVAVTMTSIQFVIGNILDPRLQGHRLDLSPFLILFSLVLWGWIWGIVGMFIAVPVMVVIKIICENIPSLHPIGIIMGAGFQRKSK